LQRHGVSAAIAAAAGFHAAEARSSGRVAADSVALVTTSTSVRPALFPNVRRSPYFPATERSGAVAYMTYNHMYMAVAFARDPREEYEALVERVCLWDVGAERQTQLRGPDALALANLLCTRDMRTLEVGQCRFTMVCDEQGSIMTEPIVLRPFEDTVWISHGDVDLTLWALGMARAHGFDVEVSEPDVAPIQVQGPRSIDLLRPIAPGVEDLRYYRCVETTVAGHPAIVSRTGWSREHAYEIYPLGTDRAMELWDALEKAGEPFGVIVAGPNLNRAVEQAITDTHWFVNSGMTPFEAGAGRLVDLESAPFVGSDALARLAETEPQRTTLGVVFDAAPGGPMQEFWPIAEGGEVCWAAFSYARERDLGVALVPARLSPGDRVTVQAPNGPIGAVVAALPFET
jgi:glycine cleavage system aminomethyltransferase T